MQTRTSIYHKLILYIFFLGIFVIIVVSLYSFITARNAILQRTFDQLTSLRVSKKEQVEQFFNDRVKEVELFSRQKNSIVIQLNTRAVKGDITLNSTNDILNGNFSKFFASSGYFEEIYIDYSGQRKRYILDSVSGKFSSSEADEKQMLDPLFKSIGNIKEVKIVDYSFQPKSQLNQNLKLQSV